MRTGVRTRTRTKTDDETITPVAAPELVGELFDIAVARRPLAPGHLEATTTPRPPKAPQGNPKKTPKEPSGYP